ncbi:MAG TPA: PepSY-associated TM helix domain-containing protein [Edaphocola sp.]|nr:PepSY-associated TM helix domain-containing protein [Edaphocola sp.]
MKITAAKRWFRWHKWTSLVCTLFLLMLCTTGLPLIFHEEIDNLLDQKEAAIIPPGGHKLTADSLVRIAEALHPGNYARYVYWDDERPNTITIDVADKPDAPVSHSHYVILNEYTGSLLGRVRTDGLMYNILQLHTDIFAGIPGKLFLGLMGILFLVSIVSGVVLYGPIMRNFDFGVVRKQKSRRLKWLDTHNLVGIVVLAWMVVVGFTGIINTLSDVVLGLWQQGQLKEMTAPYQNQPPLTGKYSSLDAAVAVAKKAAPDMKVSIVTYPGTLFSSKHHYAIFMHGNTALTAKLLKPVLVDAKTGAFTDSRSMPWYVDALFLSEPLHFGDYGGMALKIIWAVFDFLTIVVLITGLYLWFARRKSERQQWKRLEAIEKNKTSNEKIDA